MLFGIIYIYLFVATLIIDIRKGIKEHHHRVRIRKMRHGRGHKINRYRLKF